MQGCMCIWSVYMKGHVHVQRCRCIQKCEWGHVHARVYKNMPRCVCVCTHVHVSVSDKKGRDKSVLLLYFLLTLRNVQGRWKIGFNENWCPMSLKQPQFYELLTLLTHCPVLFWKKNLYSNHFKGAEAMLQCSFDSVN